MVRPGSFRVLALALSLIGALPFVLLPSPTPAAAFDEGRIALHLKAHASDSTSLCGPRSPNRERIPCSRYVTAGDLKRAYDVYLVVIRDDAIRGIGGVSCGVDYDAAPRAGVDVYGWTLCADIEFPSAGPNGLWPEAGGGTRIVWSADTNCQRTVIEGEGVHAVAGAFYVYAYSADALKLTPDNNRKGGPELTVEDCQGIRTFPDWRIAGKAAFRDGATAPGINPCASPPSPCEFIPRNVHFGDRLVGSYQDSTIRIVNLGDETRSGAISVSGPPFSLVSPAQPYQLAPGETLEVTVRFAPTEIGDFDGALDLGSRCGAIALHAIGFYPCEFTPNALDFGPVPVGDPMDATVTLRNGKPWTIGGQIAVNGSAFSLSRGAGWFSLQPGDSLKIGVRFTPKEQGTVTGWIGTGSGTGCSTLALRGTGASPCSTRPTTHDFGELAVGDSADAAFTVTNTTRRSLSGTVASSNAAFAVIRGGGPVTIPSGAAHSIVVRFQPRGSGPFTGTISAPLECQSITVDGSSPVFAARCQVRPYEPIDFNPIWPGDVRDTTVTIINSGKATNILVLDPAWFTGRPFSLLEGGGTFALAPGDTHRVRIRCAPVAEGEAWLRVVLGKPCANLDLKCDPETRPRSCAANPAVMDFGQVHIGQYRDLGFIVENALGHTATGPIEPPTGAFHLLVEGGYWLGWKSWTNRMVRFQPTLPGPQSCVIRIGGECADTVLVMGVGLASDSERFPVLLFAMSGPTEPIQHLAYEVAESAPVTLTIHDVVGRSVAAFDEGYRSPGRFDLFWNSGDRPGGIYFVSLRAGGREISRRLLLLR